jgi:predicted alpha/beta-fold hydrolase
MEIEKELTMKAFCFESFEQFHKESSSINFIYDLKIPSLFISSRDDRLSPVDVIDTRKGNFIVTIVQENPYIIFLLTELGGHLCYFTGHLTPRRVNIL